MNQRTRRRKSRVIDKRLTLEEKIEVLRKAWRYVGVVETTATVSGWRLWLVKNYSGPPIGRRPLSPGEGLPGNPTATRKHEHSSYTRKNAINLAYYSWKRILKKRG